MRTENLGRASGTRCAEIALRGRFGGHAPWRTPFWQTDLILVSPGVDQRIAPVRQARERGIPVWGEIELAARFISEPVVAVTGTNGKTTTTALLGTMLEKSGIPVFVGGNIGDPPDRLCRPGGKSPGDRRRGQQLSARHH